MTPAELLDLRRRTCEALGWKIVEDEKSGQVTDMNLCRPDGSVYVAFRRAFSGSGWQYAPKLESDNGLALDALVQFCAEKHYRWRIDYDGNVFYALIVNRGSGNAETPAIAICAAICKAGGSQ